MTFCNDGVNDGVNDVLTDGVRAEIVMENRETTSATNHDGLVNGKRLTV
jgi:hypothetical protein